MQSHTRVVGNASRDKFDAPGIAIDTGSIGCFAPLRWVDRLPQTARRTSAHALPPGRQWLRHGAGRDFHFLHGALIAATLPDD
ncbi:hypothetical protein GCM10023307_25040 [Lysobacter hankyongensis]|uniref:Uncharacterized protein n=2 Tax=Lysobacter hankyongensis TaxID=1176535 RepID=A0ABP9BNR4_9GAMM